MGIKYDSEKLKWHVVPFRELTEVVRVLNFGAKKYSAEGWKGLDDYNNRYFDAAMRHLIAWRENEIIDPESGYHHTAHAICNLLFLMYKNMEDEQL